MIHEPEFIRGNQKSYIRVPCEEKMLQSYEYQMCSYNTLKSFLSFQQRSQNGTNYLYYEISGMQSLDIYLQTQKVKRSLVIMLAKHIGKLCKELSEYALDMDGVIFSPRYIMIAANGDEVRFLYSFRHSGSVWQELESLLEYCIEYLDYQDELLMEKMFALYERLVEQQDNFLLEQELDGLREALMEPEVVDISAAIQRDQEIICTDIRDGNIAISEEQSEEQVSRVAQKEYRGLKRSLVILLGLDVVAVFFWKPLTLLKIFFIMAAGIVLVLLNIIVHRKEKNQRKAVLEKQQNDNYILEYEALAAQNVAEENYTQFIAVEDSPGILYNLQGCEPQYIYIGVSQQIIGKDSERAQVALPYDGISRVHALVVKEGTECIIEDLNSTNGTWINGSALEPRNRYVLKPGDKVRFAGIEYIFR